MNSLPTLSLTNFHCRMLPANAGITPKPKSRSVRAHITKQRGVVLFFTLIALLAMSLAAVALIRSVDTSTMISGNLAFKQAATTAGDSGVEAAMIWLNTTQLANDAKNVLNDATHTFNITDKPNGYYSNADPALSLTDSSVTPHVKWDDTDTVLVGTDNGGNERRYVIERMCRTANTAVQSADCLFGMDASYTGPMGIPYPQTQCNTVDCPSTGQTPLLRITVRITGPKNSVSYVQCFVS